MNAVNNCGDLSPQMGRASGLFGMKEHCC